MACSADLNTTGYDEKESIGPPPEPPEFGVNEREDCDQAAIGSSVCDLVLLDQNETANVCCDIYGSKKIINILSKTKLRNNFLNLWSNHKKNILINLRKNNKDFIIKKLHTKNITHK